YIWCKPDKGMRIRPLGMHGSKRVSDVIREACLTSSATENILILCRRSDYVPIWIPGIKRAAADLITPESESIYIIRPV
ncbi:MAG: hypothetical protein K2M03_02915, partial [Muribaculaceae bacterium]|nr:hypothetical protein [Muribaculaceae bacterium]